MRYLVLDTRFKSPVHVFLDANPEAERGFPDLAVRRVSLEPMTSAGTTGSAVSSSGSIGQDPWRPDEFREFGSDVAATAAGFALIEPRFVGATWAAYDRAFRFGGRTVRGNG